MILDCFHVNFLQQIPPFSQSIFINRGVSMSPYFSVLIIKTTW